MVRNLTLRIVSEADAKCQECYKQDTMLCCGVRAFIASNGNNFKYGKCQKLLNKEAKDKTTFQYESSGLPNQIVSNINLYNNLNIKLTNSKLIVNDSLTISASGVINAKDEYTAYRVVSSLINNGYKAKYIYSKIFYRWLDYSKLEIDDMFSNSVEFIWVDYPDQVSCSAYMRDRFFAYLHNRVLVGKPTIVRLYDKVDIQNQTEADFYKLINQTGIISL
jgi:hypothetical protein